MVNLADSVLAIILAGGGGERLSVLTEKRTKPAVPFAGKYRIIDFTLSNCINSGIYNIAFLTQYQPLSLIEHIGVGTPWDLDRPGSAMRVLQAHLTRNGHDWYKGTADAVYQNLEYIKQQDTELVLILSGDHIYTMDYSGMLKFHQQTQADVTLAVTRFPEAELEQFGTVTIDETGRVTCFQEKVKEPKSNLVSMGVYLFKKDVLKQSLDEDAQIMTSKHDFGENVIPATIGNRRVFAYNFVGYWRDVGTIQMYWQVNRDLLEMSPSPLFNNEWPIHTKKEERPPAIISETAKVIDSLVCDGCVIEGLVEHSILSPGVRVVKDAVVKDSIIMSDTIIGPHSVIDHSILDKEVLVEAGCHIGFGDDFQPNREEPQLLYTGITIIGKKARIPPGVNIGRNCIICCGVADNDFPSPKIQSGETIHTK